MISTKQKEGNCIVTHGYTLSRASTIDALPIAFWSFGLCVGTFTVARRGLHNVLWLAKHGAECPPPGYPYVYSVLVPSGWCVGITTWFVAWPWPLVAMWWHYSWLCGLERLGFSHTWPADIFRIDTCMNGSTHEGMPPESPRTHLACYILLLLNWRSRQRKALSCWAFIKIKYIKMAKSDKTSIKLHAGPHVSGVCERHTNTRLPLL